MSSEWIKFRKKLLRDGRVLALSRICHAARVTVIGALVTLWAIADEYTEENGVLPGYSIDDLNAEIGVENFCQNLPSDWFHVDEDGTITLPNYHQHNGVTARKRDLAARRQSSRRQRDSVVTQPSRTQRDKSVTREEKRREEDKYTPHSPPEGVDAPHRTTTSTPSKAASNQPPEGFDRFWAAYPRKVAKPVAMRAFRTLKPDAALLDVMLAALERQKLSEQWVRDGGNFIPHPSTWLNQRRWEDEPGPAANGTGSRQGETLEEKLRRIQGEFTWRRQDGSANGACDTPESSASPTTPG